MYNMTGKWIGSYRYSSRLMQNLIPQNETGFEITINEFDGIPLKRQSVLARRPPRA